LNHSQVSATVAQTSGRTSGLLYRRLAVGRQAQPWDVGTRPAPRRLQAAASLRYSHGGRRADILVRSNVVRELAFGSCCGLESPRAAVLARRHLTDYGSRVGFIFSKPPVLALGSSADFRSAYRDLGAFLDDRAFPIRLQAMPSADRSEKTAKGFMSGA